MMRPVLRSPQPWLCGMFLLGACQDVTLPPKQNLDEAFPAEQALEVSIDLADEDFAALASQTRNLLDLLAGDNCISDPFESPFTFFPGTITIDGVTREQVGVRKKGFIGSLSSVRPSFKIDLEEFVSDSSQELADLEKLSFNNSQQDPSRIRTCLAFGLFAEAGLPAPRCSLAHVTVNGDDLGVYSHVETVNKDFLKRNFANPDGNLFEGTISDFRPEFFGTFEQDTNKDTPDNRALVALTEALALPDDQVLAALEPLVDIDQFLTFWAMEVIVGHFDGYASNTNNFYVYVDPRDGKMRFIPHGPDGTFLDVSFLPPNGETPLSVFATGILPRRLYLLPETQARYITRLQELLDTVWDEEKLLARVDRLSSIVEQFDTSEEGAAGREQIRDFVRTRQAALEAELANGAPVFSAPLRDDFCFSVIGDAAGDFSTEFGTLDDANVFATGNATFSLNERDIDIVMQPVASAAGFDPNAENVPSVRILGVREDGTFSILAINVPTRFEPGTLRFDVFGEAPIGVVGNLNPATGAFAIEGFLHGELTLTEASTTEGERIEGTFSGEIVELVF